MHLFEHMIGHADDAGRPLLLVDDRLQPAVRLDPSVRFAEVMRIVKKAAEEAALEAARAPGNAARGDGELRV